MDRIEIPEDLLSFAYQQASMNFVNSDFEDPDHKSLFDDDEQKPRDVPGTQEKYIPWGSDNRLPFELNQLISDDEVTAQNKLFNTLACYGAGLTFNDEETGLPSKNEALCQWIRFQNLPAFFLSQCTDMKHFYFTVCILILSKDLRHINRIVHKEACYCRFAPVDRTGRIPYVYYALWNKDFLKKEDIEKIPLLDINNPYGDLLVRTGRRRDKRGEFSKDRNRKFAILTRFPTVGCNYYPKPYWTAIFRGGSYDDKKTIQSGKRAKLANGSSIKYQIEVERGFYERICAEEGITDKAEMIERIKKEKENIQRYVMGVHNAGKSLITKYYVDPFGHEQRDVRINIIDSKKEGGEWAADEAACINTMCFAENNYPDLQGAVPGRNQNNTSGTDKREMFTIKQSFEIAYHDIMLLPLNIVCWYEKWNVVPTVPMIQLTTLDEHKDTKRVNVNKNKGNGDLN